MEVFLNKIHILIKGLDSFLIWFDKHNGLVQAIATVILVWITIRSIKEAENTRKDNRLPIIKLEIEGPVNYGKAGQRMSFKVENIGYGLAIDVKLNFTFNTIETIDFSNIEAGIQEGVSIEISKEKLDEMRKATKFFDVLTVSYEDIFGRRVTTFASIVDENEGTKHDWPVLVVSKWRVSLPE
jgi:hypothetical protein